MATESFFSNASLAYLASAGAGKDGKTYSIKPTDGSGDFTFSRGSNLAATRVGPTGLIEKGRENLLLQSNNFDTFPWRNANATPTSGQSGYDGTNDAWLLQATTTGQNFRYYDISVSSVYTISIYAKAGTTNWFFFYAVSGGAAWFDLGNGVVGHLNSGIVSSSIESVGNGWYRCSATYNGNLSSMRVYLSDGNNNVNATTGANILIQDAQLEIGLAATEVITTGATTGKAGLLEDEPRFDYSGGATCPSLLLEPSRTQLAGYSEYFEGWNNKTNVTITSNYTTSPEGLQNASRSVFTGNGFLLNAGAPTQVIGTQYTLSCYAKRNDSGTQNFGFFKNGSGTVDSAMALTSDWKRFDYTYTASNNSQLGLAGVIGADVSIYGFQAEAAPYPTSYIPNHSGGSVTRGFDNCFDAGNSSTFNDSEGVLYAEIKHFIGGDYIISLSDGTNDNRILFIKNANSTYRMYVESSTTQVNLSTTTTFSDDSYHKIALSYKEDDFKLYVDGNLELYDASGSTPVGLSQVEFYNPSGSGDFVGNAKQLLVFPEALSDADCISLTTL